MLELAYRADSNSAAREGLWVRVPPAVPPDVRAQDGATCRRAALQLGLPVATAIVISSSGGPSSADLRHLRFRPSSDKESRAEASRSRTAPHGRARDPGRTLPSRASVRNLSQMLATAAGAKDSTGSKRQMRWRGSRSCSETGREPRSPPQTSVSCRPHKLLTRTDRGMPATRAVDRNALRHPGHTSC